MQLDKHLELKLRHQPVKRGQVKQGPEYEISIRRPGKIASERIVAPGNVLH